MYLKNSKRQQEDQARFLDLLEKARCGNPSKYIMQKDAEYICYFHLWQSHFSEEDLHHMMSDTETLFLYATNDKKEKYNMHMLKRQHSTSNPVAVVKTYTVNKHGVGISNNSKHFKGNSHILNKTLLCRNAKVSLYGRNIKPEWGLFNGAQGIVKEIVYEPGKSPIANDLSQYVLVTLLLFKEVPSIAAIILCKNNSHLSGGVVLRVPCPMVSPLIPSNV